MPRIGCGLAGDTWERIEPLIVARLVDVDVPVTGLPRVAARRPTTHGRLDNPFGHEVSGIDVPDLAATLARARTNGATVLWGPYTGLGGHSAMVRFPGGFITEIHDGTLR
jgi:hypothetical protein